MAGARRARGAGDLVSFGWRDRLGDEGGVALGEGGLDFAVADRCLRLASDIAQRWFATGGREYLSWNGVPVGAAPAADLFPFFQSHLKLNAVLEHVLARWRPEAVAFVDDGSTTVDLLRAVLPARGVRYRVLGPAVGKRLARRAGLYGRRFFWPAMFGAARRRASAGGQAPERDGRMKDAGAVVFWGQFGGYELDVYDGVRRAYGEEITYFAGTVAAARGARARGVLCSHLYERRPAAGRVRALFSLLAREYRALPAAGRFDAFDLPPGLAAFFRDHFPFRPGAYLISLAFTAVAVDDFLARWRPSLVVHMSDAHLTGRFVAALAAGRGIPALVIQNHITGGPTFGYLPLSSTRMAAWGKVSYDWLLAGGAAPERVTVVGSPYAAVMGRIYQEAREGLGAAPRDALVVATNNFDADHNRALALAGAAYARGRPRVRLVFRPHPTESGALYRALIKEYGLTRAEVAHRTPLADLLAGAAALVTGHSGIGVDAVLAGVPLVHVNLMKGVPDYIPYVAFGAAQGVTDVAALCAALDDALASPRGRWEEGRRAFAAAYLGADAGEPFANIAALARELERR